MSTPQIRNLIAEINNLLSRPLGSATKVSSLEVIRQREQLKHLRSKLENVSAEEDISELEQECNFLINQIQSQQKQLQFDAPQAPINIGTSQIVSAATQPDWTKEIGTMVNRKPEAALLGIDEQVTAILQQTIQQAIQQVIQQTVQQTVRQTLEQALTVERALTIGEINANLRNLLEGQKRSQLNSELQELEMRKQALRQEINQLETERQAQVEQIIEDQKQQQSAIVESLESINDYLRDQVKGEIDRSVVESLNSVELPKAISTGIADDYQHALIERVKAQTDRFLLTLDDMFNATFSSLEQDIQGYKHALTEKLEQIEDIEQKGESILSALIERMSSQMEGLPASSLSLSPDTLEILASNSETNTVDLPSASGYVDYVDADLIDNLLAQAATLDSSATPQEQIIDEIDEEDDFLEQIVNSEVVTKPSETVEIIETVAEERFTLEADLFEKFTSSDLTHGDEVTSQSAAIGAQQEQIVPPTIYSTHTESEAVTPIRFEDSPIAGELSLAAEEDDFSEFLKELDPSYIEESATAIAESSSASTFDPSDFDTDAETEIFGYHDSFVKVDTPAIKDVQEVESTLNALNTALADINNESSDKKDVGENEDNSQFLEWLNSQPDTLTVEANKTPHLPGVDEEESFLGWLEREPNAAESDLINTPPVEHIQQESSLETDDLSIDRASWINDSLTDSDVMNIETETSEPDVSAPQPNLLDMMNLDETDSAGDSDESLILLPDADEVAQPRSWIDDSLVRELNADLESLEAGIGISPLVAANLDLAIRNTPFSGTADETHQEASTDAKKLEQLHVPPQNGKSTDLPSSLYQIDDLSNSLESIDFSELDDRMIEESLEEAIAQIPEIIEDPEALFGNSDREVVQFLTSNEANNENATETAEDIFLDSFLEESNDQVSSVTTGVEIPEIIEDPEALFANPSLEDIPQLNLSNNDDTGGLEAFVDNLAASLSQGASTSENTIEELSNISIDSVENSGDLFSESDDISIDSLINSDDLFPESDDILINSLENPNDLFSESDDISIGSLENPNNLFPESDDISIGSLENPNDLFADLSIPDLNESIDTTGTLDSIANLDDENTILENNSDLNLVPTADPLGDLFADLPDDFSVLHRENSQSHIAASRDTNDSNTAGNLTNADDLFADLPDDFSVLHREDAQFDLPIEPVSSASNSNSLKVDIAHAPDDDLKVDIANTNSSLPHSTISNLAYSDDLDTTLPDSSLDTTIVDATVFQIGNIGDETASSSTSKPTTEDSNELDNLIEGLEVNLDNDFSELLKELEPSEEFETVLQGYLPTIETNELDSVLNSLDNNLFEQNFPLPTTDEAGIDDFFAALENDKLNQFADEASTTIPEVADTHQNASRIADHLPEEDDPLSEVELKLTEFADLDDQELDWDDFIESNALALEQHANLSVLSQSSDQSTDMNAVLFNVDEAGKSIPLNRHSVDSSNTSSNFTDVEFFDVELSTDDDAKTLLEIQIPPPAEETIDYKVNDTWFLGIDFGSACLRASLVNGNTYKVYPLEFPNGCTYLPSAVVWESEVGCDDPMVELVQLVASHTENLGEEQLMLLPDTSATQDRATNVTNFKHLLKLGLPYRGISSWQPIIQYSEQHQISLRWLQSALKTLFVFLQNEAKYERIPDIKDILQNLSGIVLGHPTNWSDTYVLSIREAALQSGLVKQAEQVMVVGQSVAPLMNLIHERQTPQHPTLIVDSGAYTTNLYLIKAHRGYEIKRVDTHDRSFDYAGLGIDQDIVTQLLYPHWRIITNPERDICNLDGLDLPSAGDPAPSQRALLQQYLHSSNVGLKLLNLAELLKIELATHSDRDQWYGEINGQPLTVLRRELESLVLLPFIQKLNREMNILLSSAGVAAEDITEVWQLGGTMLIPSISRWLQQKLPNATQINRMESNTVANGLALAPLYRHLLDIARQQYSDYFLLEEICRLNLNSAVSLNGLIQQLQNRGVNAKTCRDRILNILQGELPSGLFPWQEPEHKIMLGDPSISPSLFTGRLFELETDGSYQPDLNKFQLLRNYLQAILANMQQTLNEPLVFPEFTIGDRVAKN